MNPKSEQNIIVYDLETKKTFDEVGGRGFVDQKNHHLLEVSFLGVYSYSQQKYFGFFENELPIWEKILLNEKPMIVGFNTKGFDNKVLQPYFKQCVLADLPQLDMLEEVYKSLGFRIKLDNLAKASLGYGKSGTGLDAIKYFRTGDMKSLAQYCMDDVRVTKELFEYGLRHGQLLYPTGGEIRPAKISWGESPFIRDMVAEAFQKHLQLKIRCWMAKEDGGKPEVCERLIDVRGIFGQQIDAFCNDTHSQETLDLGRILSAELTNQKFFHQTSLI